MGKPDALSQRPDHGNGASDNASLEARSMFSGMQTYEGNVMLYKCLNKISGNLHPNNQNNWLERRAWPSRDIP